MKNLITISDITFIGSGISTSFSIINFLKLLETDETIKKKVRITVIEKYSEFNTGIPYGKRSGFSTLLITNLKNFLPEPELKPFIEWLNINKDWLLEEMKNEGDTLTEKWLSDNIESINNGDWEELFIPRRFFGLYINHMLNSKINYLKKRVDVNYVTATAVDLFKNNNIYNITLKNGNYFLSKKVVLSVGSLPTRMLYKNKNILKRKNLMLVNTPYVPNINKNLKKINEFLTKRSKNKETNVLIVGANASALEMLYKLNDNSKNRARPINYVFLSTQGRAPDAYIDDERKEAFQPVNLLNLKDEKELSAKAIADAAFEDINLSDSIQLGAASTIEKISSAFGDLLNKLSEDELHKFACNYGNQIGQKQRCAGMHYSNTIKWLKDRDRFNHLAGRFIDLKKDKETLEYKVQFLNTETQQEEIYPKNFHLVINCIGGKNLKSKKLPPLINNLIKNKYCIPNKSNIGFKINKKLEAQNDLHIMGPLLAGNVINNSPVWHVEHCGRIIWISKLLSKIIFKDLASQDRFENPEQISHIKFLENGKSKLEAITDEKNWNDCITKSNIYDFYHTYGYHQIARYRNETPVLLKYSTKDYILALPLLVRDIPCSDYKDATSAYGYVGPVVIGNLPTNFNNSDFIKEILDYFKIHRIISVFARLNPFIDSQNKILENFGETIQQGKVVFMDLNQKPNTLRANYRSRLKTHINKARRHCSIKTGNSLEDINTFIDIYYENMDRVNAKESYYFSRDYFHKLVKNKNFKTIILSVVHHETQETIAASMFISVGPIIHYHLSGSKTKFLDLMPTKLLIDEMRIIAAKKGYTFFNLGGGLGGRDDDSLFDFKSSFSKDFKDFYLWKLIVNPDIYKELVQKKGVNVESDYFPLYRIFDDLIVKL
ncbi:peptidoglycan bridge formation glycyltransferase FemA/FemB family protein [Flavobacteriaceae bacterium GSB9]|nr:peptidoglycan bridge formation glycyltransferase FemA/FemB family protein [Flavobacteriaceae bacterium GSB9]